jgi:hypothetical protein
MRQVIFDARRDLAALVYEAPAFKWRPAAFQLETMRPPNGGLRSWAA